MRMFGGTHVIKKFSLYDRLYTLNLTRIPSDLDDDAIFDYFARLGLYVLITATQQVGGMISHDRTIWRTTQDCPAALMLPDGASIREIFFDGFDDPVLVQHKQRSLNTNPPSNVACDLARRAADDARRALRVTHRDVDRVARPTPAAATSSGTSANSVAPFVPPEDVRLDLLRPEPSSSLLEWTSVTRLFVCTRTESRPQPTVIGCDATLTEDGRMIFGIPAPPTDFELALADDCADVDVDVFLDGSATVAPVVPSHAVGQLIDARSLLTVSRTKMKRSRFRRLADTARDHFLSSGDPESRLAFITAQPLVIASTLYDVNDASSRVLVEQAVLRAYSAFPASSHTASRQFAPRIKVDFPHTSPSAGVILTHIYPPLPGRETAQAYDAVDLFYHTHAARIHNDPFKIVAVTGILAPDFLPFPNLCCGRTPFFTPYVNLTYRTRLATASLITSIPR